MQQRRPLLDALSSVLTTDPKEFDALKMKMSLGMKDFVDAEHKKATLAQTTQQAAVTAAQTAARDAEAARAHKANEGIAAGNLAVNQGELSIKREQAKADGGRGKPPAGYQWGADGTLQFIKGGPADPATKQAGPLNDVQSKALLFGTRAQESDKILGALASQGHTLPPMGNRIADTIPLIGGAVRMGTNAFASPEGQQIEQAQRDFINAVLRRESGAVISQPEFENAAKQYFVQPNDSAAVKKQKAANRELTIKGLLAEVPEDKRASITPKAAEKSTVIKWSDLPSGR
jgi:hypothetical protein